MTHTINDLMQVLEAIAQGYPARGTMDHLVIVQNPKATPEAIAMQGVHSNLVVDTDKVRDMLEAEYHIYRCTGCGHMTHNRVSDAQRFRDVGLVSCCPERNMQMTSLAALSAEINTLRSAQYRIKPLVWELDSNWHREHHDDEGVIENMWAANQLGWTWGWAEQHKNGDWVLLMNGRHTFESEPRCKEQAERLFRLRLEEGSEPAR